MGLAYRRSPGGSCRPDCLADRSPPGRPAGRQLRKLDSGCTRRVSVDGNLGPAVDLHIGNGAAVLGREVSGEGLLGLIHVVVGVEDGKIDGPVLHGGHLPIGVVITPQTGPPVQQSPSVTHPWSRHGGRCHESGSTRHGLLPGPLAPPLCNRPGRTRRMGRRRTSPWH